MVEFEDVFEWISSEQYIQARTLFPYNIVLNSVYGGRGIDWFPII